MKRAVTSLFLICAGSVPLISTPSAAGETGLFSRLSATLGFAREVETPEGRLSGELTACLQLAVGNAHGPSIGFTVDLDDSGSPVADPALLVSSASDAASQHQLSRAGIAVKNCLPLYFSESPLTNVRLTLALDENQITFLEKEPLFQAPPALAPDFAEIALGLETDEVKGVQQRLNLAGFEPGKADGVLGPKTREALSEWQEANALSGTGYLDRNGYDLLIEQTDEAFEKHQKSTRSKRRVARFVRGKDGCLRYRRSQRIVPHQSAKCDLRGMVESF